MSHTEVDTIPRTVEKTREWIAAVSVSLGQDEHRAWLALRAVLHSLRDRLPLETLGHVCAQLPMLIRGLMFEGWDPTGKPERLGKAEILARVQREALLDSPAEAEVVVRAVADVLWSHLSEGVMQHVAETLPTDLELLLY